MSNPLYDPGTWECPKGHKFERKLYTDGKCPTCKAQGKPVPKAAVTPSTKPQPSNFDKVAEFHRKFGHPVRTKPEVPSNAERLARLNFLLEEVREFAAASGIEIGIEVLEVSDNAEDIDIVEAADALADIEYVTHGAALVWGFPSQKVFDEVQRSNMSKLWPDGKPRYSDKDNKILKGPNYSQPNIKPLLGL